MVTIHGEPIGYTEIKWGPPGRGGDRVGVRYARYADEGDDPSNWNQNVPNPPATAAGHLRDTGEFIAHVLNSVQQRFGKRQLKGEKPMTVG